MQLFISTVVAPGAADCPYLLTDSHRMQLKRTLHPMVGPRHLVVVPPVCMAVLNREQHACNCPACMRCPPC